MFHSKTSALITNVQWETIWTLEKYDKKKNTCGFQIDESNKSFDNCYQIWNTTANLLNV